MRAKYNQGGGTALDQFMAKYQNGGVNNTEGDPVNYNTESDRQKSDQGLISYQDPPFLILI